VAAGVVRPPESFAVAVLRLLSSDGAPNRRFVDASQSSPCGALAMQRGPFARPWAPC